MTVEFSRNVCGEPGNTTLSAGTPDAAIAYTYKRCGRPSHNGVGIDKRKPVAPVAGAARGMLAGAAPMNVPPPPAGPSTYACTLIAVDGAAESCAQPDAMPF